MFEKIRVGPLAIVIIALFFGIINHFCSGVSRITPLEKRVVVKEYSFITETGESKKLSDFRGKILVLETGACTSGG